MPAINDTERNRLRKRLGHDVTSLLDADADDLFTQAEELYASRSRAVQFQQAVVIGRQDLLAEAVKRVTYDAGDASENLSDVAKAIQKMLQDDMAQLDMLLSNDQASAVRIVGTRRKPTRKKEYPDD